MSESDASAGDFRNGFEDVDSSKMGPAVTFCQTENGLSVIIETTRLYLRSVTQGDINHYIDLFGDPKVMEKFATGKTKSTSQIQERLTGWISRWNSSDPYSGFAVFIPSMVNGKRISGHSEFIGHVALGHGDRPSESELGFLFRREYWRQGYASEAVNAIVRDYAKATVERGYKLEGAVLEKIVATARPDNEASWRILEKVGMHLEYNEEKFGAVRYHYGVQLIEIT